MDEAGPAGIADDEPTTGLGRFAGVSESISTRISVEAVAKVARLARLSLDADELQRATAQLGDVLDHFADIDALDLDGIEPMTHPTPIANVMREDFERECLDRDEVLAAAPAAESGRFLVPPIVGLQE